MLTERDNEALTILMEECAELIVMASKIKRFGVKDSMTPLGATTLARFVQEAADVTCMLDILQRGGVVTFTEQEFNAAIASKQAKLRKFSKHCG
jgi:hypothetical protein